MKMIFLKLPTVEILFFLSKCFFLKLRSKGISSKFQRFVTNSDFDHVALVIKGCIQDSDNLENIFIYESLGGHGVQMISWKEFKNRKWHNLYEK